MDLLAIAKKIADRAEAESFKQNVSVAVTVIDIDGNVVLTHHMTGAPAFALELSGRKACTSALGRMLPSASRMKPQAREGEVASPSSHDFAGQ